MKAYLDPLGLKDGRDLLAYPLDPVMFGLAKNEDVYPVASLLHSFPHSKGSVYDVVGYLEDMYCGTMALEVTHVSVCLYRLLSIVLPEL